MTKRFPLLTVAAACIAGSLFNGAQAMTASVSPAHPTTLTPVSIIVTETYDGKCFYADNVSWQRQGQNITVDITRSMLDPPCYLQESTDSWSVDIGLLPEGRYELAASIWDGDWWRPLPPSDGTNRLLTASVKFSFHVRLSSLEGDANGDCLVNIGDLLFTRNRLGKDAATGDNWKADVNRDGKVDVLDLLLVRSRLNTTCESSRRVHTLR